MSNEIEKEITAIFDYIIKNNYCSISKAIKILQKKKKIREFVSFEGHRSNFQRSRHRKKLIEMVAVFNSQTPIYEFLQPDRHGMSVSFAKHTISKFEQTNFHGRIMTLEVKKAYEILSKIQ